MKMTNHLKSLQKVFIEYPKIYIAKKRELIEVEKERQDLLHVLELGKLDAVKMGKITRELKAVQIKRRQIKDNLEVLEIINRFSKAYKNNQHKEKQIKSMTDSVNNVVNRNRRYKMRVRTDLQELVDGK